MEIGKDKATLWVQPIVTLILTVVETKEGSTPRMCFFSLTEELTVQMQTSEMWHLCLYLHVSMFLAVFFIVGRVELQLHRVCWVFFFFNWICMKSLQYLKKLWKLLIQAVLYRTFCSFPKWSKQDNTYPGIDCYSFPLTATKDLQCEGNCAVTHTPSNDWLWHTMDSIYHREKQNSSI